jgi:hypothetical protein
MSQNQGAHPKEFVRCAECGNHPPDAWEKKRNLPQIGQTYECNECEHEVYVYDSGDRGETILQWRPVTTDMAKSLLFFDHVGDWPDSALTDLFKQGVERAAAIDYEIVENQGLSQSEWARQTERQQPSVSGNISDAKEQLGDA